MLHIICDIDGTVADASHRIPFIQRKPKDWDSFFAKVGEDKPHKDILGLLCTILWCDWIDADPPEIVFVSGRPERTRGDTERWLKLHTHRLPYRALFMRPDGDRRADDIVKEEILDTHLIPAGITPQTTWFVLDDRDRVVQMWRRRGFRVLQVANGDF